MANDWIADNEPRPGPSWRTFAQIVALTAEMIEVRVPGGWDPAGVEPGSAPDWLRHASVGQHAICTARSRSDDSIEITDWHGLLPIGLSAHPFNFSDYEALPEGKLELVNGVLYGDPATRDAMAAALLCNLGLTEVVRLASPELWRRALEDAASRP